MKKINLKITVFSVLCFALLSAGTAAFAQSVPQIQTSSATNIQNNSATLNATINYVGNSTNTTVWFQWGTTTGYGNQTAQQTQSYAGATSQTISGLTPNTTYHFQVVAQNSYGTVYGQDMTFYTNQSGTGNVNGNFSVQTNSPTYVQNNSATLNGTLTVANNSYNYNSTGALVWFQWGTDTNYGSSSFQETLGGYGTFLQQIANLNPNATYHYRAVAQINGQIIYGQDMTFTTNTTGGNSGAGTLTVTKQVINLSSGNLNWQTSTNASPGDILSFAITLQANNQDIHNVLVTDTLPSNLIYKGNLTMNSVLNSSQNPMSGINVGTITAGGIEIISYQAQVASGSSFSAGATTISSNATITSTEAGTQTASASISVNNSQAAGPTSVSTGETNNFFTDSFFLPIALIILMSWLYFTGRVYEFADWLDERMN